MNKKNSLLLAGLMLLGIGCASQLKAFSLNNLVPACIQQYVERKKLEYEKTLLKRRKASVQEYLKHIEQSIQDVIEEFYLRDTARCKFQVVASPKLYDDLILRYANLKIEKRQLEDELKKITDELDKLSNKPK